MKNNLRLVHTVCQKKPRITLLKIYKIHTIILVFNKMLASKYVRSICWQTYHLWKSDVILNK